MFPIVEFDLPDRIYTGIYNSYIISYCRTTCTQIPIIKNVVRYTNIERFKKYQMRTCAIWRLYVEYRSTDVPYVCRGSKIIPTPRYSTWIISNKSNDADTTTSFPYINRVDKISIVPMRLEKLVQRDKTPRSEVRYSARARAPQKFLWRKLDESSAVVLYYTAGR